MGGEARLKLIHSLTKLMGNPSNVASVHISCDLRIANTLHGKDSCTDGTHL